MHLVFVVEAVQSMIAVIILMNLLGGHVTLTLGSIG